MASMISEDDYPAEALRKHEEGTVGVRLDIDASGRVFACTVTQSAGSASLDAATCALLTRRSRFKPATDSAGRAIADVFTTRITWKISEATKPGPIQPTLSAWMSCLQTSIHALVPTRATRDEIADKALAGCTTQEAAMVTAANPGMPPPSKTFLEGTRGGMRRFLLQRIDEARGGAPH